MQFDYTALNKSYYKEFILTLKRQNLRQNSLERPDLCNFTADELRTNKKSVKIVEAKNTKENGLPGLLDIKDGLTKMILFTNLSEASVGKKIYKIVPVLKLTSKSKKKLSKAEKSTLDMLRKEANLNHFRIDF